MEEMISTGQAAKFCSVTPDTILKWIKNNKLQAVKTAGGHFRVSKENLKPYMVKTDENKPTPAKQIHYCWEYHAQNGKIVENCRECVIFKLKAEKCFLIAGAGKDKGHAQTFCKESCYECEFFHLMNETPKNVLIISENKQLKSGINSETNNGMNVKCSCCGYETSTIIQEFHPNYIIIDESMVKSSSDEICKHILKDPRAHGSQIIFAVADTDKDKKLPEGVCASITVPFNSSDIKECFQRLQNNFFGKLSA